MPYLPANSELRWIELPKWNKDSQEKVPEGNASKHTDDI